MSFMPEYKPQQSRPMSVGLGFTRAARLCAIIGVALGICAVVLGGFAFLADGDSLSTIVVVAGLGAIIGSISLGVLSEISLSVSKTDSVRNNASTSRSSVAPTDPVERKKWANREPPYDE